MGNVSQHGERHENDNRGGRTVFFDVLKHNTPHKPFRMQSVCCYTVRTRVSKILGSRGEEPEMKKPREDTRGFLC